MAGAGPLVSVVMPSFNQAGFIEDAVRSVFEQDSGPLELIVMDGGSCYGTLQCLERLAGIYGSALRWISEPDRGPAHAINKAIALARGEVIGWLNSDDLYEPGAIRSALAEFSKSPELVMVYGEGRHVDASGRALAPYPTRPPSAGLASFADGCFICQPTAFLRREVFATLGPLDEGLATAFDFELWLRVFKAYPGCIGFVPQVLASSRLHEDCITSRLRKQVACEAVEILHRHLARAPIHWLLTYRDELFATHPFGDAPASLHGHLSELADQYAHCFDAVELQSFRRQLAEDVRLKLALPGVFVTVDSDGWAGRSISVRLASIPKYCSTLRLNCSHESPIAEQLTLDVKTAWGTSERIRVDRRGPFEVRLSLGGASSALEAMAEITADKVFVPRNVGRGQADDRELSFRVHGLDFE